MCKRRSLTPAHAVCRRECGGAGRNLLPARDKSKPRGPRKMEHFVGNVSDKWCLKTVWGVGYKFEV